MKRLAIVLLPLAICLPLVNSLRACAPVTSPGSTAQIADESAIIIWDAKSKTQHFIRRASFLTSANDLGFLVPTPTKPELAEANDDAFKHLESVTAPKVVEQVRRYPGYGKHYGGMKTMALPGGGGMPVRVLGEGHVGHLDYAILEADRPDALNDWLKKHGYASRPELTAWLKHYVDLRWKITAFKFAKDAKEVGLTNGLTTSALRMTFSTDRPFYPYSEPADSRPAFGADSRLLRVYFIGEGRVRGAFDRRGNWSSGVVWANRLDAVEQDTLLDHLKLPHTAAPSDAWLTEFEDRSAPRDGSEDLFFSTDVAQLKVARPVIIKEVDPPPPNPARPLAIVGGITGGIVALLILAALVFWRKGQASGEA